MVLEKSGKLKPSEKRHKAARGALRPIEAEHVLDLSLKSVIFLNWKLGQMEVHRGAL